MEEAMGLIRTTVVGSALILSAVALAACGSSGGPPSSSGDSSTDLTITVTPGFTGDTSLYVAADKGFLAKEGLKASFIDISTQPIEPIFSNSAQIATSSPAVAVAAEAQGETPKVIVTLQSRITQALLVRPDIAKKLHLQAGDFPAVVRALKGLTIGISTRGGSVDLDLRYILQQAGLNPDSDVKIVPLGAAAQMIAAMQAGRVDAVLGYSPMQYQLVADGGAVDVLNLAKGQGPTSLNQPFLNAVVTSSYLKANPGIVKKFVTAIDDTCAYIKNPANSAGVASVVKSQFSTLNAATVSSVVAEVQGTCDTGFTNAQFANVLKVNATSGSNKTITADQVLATGVVPGR
jgi:NitT/TauT family transport system substrate-binding protein